MQTVSSADQRFEPLFSPHMAAGFTKVFTSADPAPHAIGMPKATTKRTATNPTTAPKTRPHKIGGRVKVVFRTAELHSSKLIQPTFLRVSITSPV